jgi:hypothetical protein
MAPHESARTTKLYKRRNAPDRGEVLLDGRRAVAAAHRQSRTGCAAPRVSVFCRPISVVRIAFIRTLSDPYNSGSVRTMGIARGQNDAIAPQVFGAVQGDVRTCDNL